MKKLLILLLALCMLVALCACGETADGDSGGTTTTTTSTSASTTTTTQDSSKVTYTVTVVNEQNEPIAGAMVQLCLETCFPAVADENGVATFSLDEADYKVSFLTAPEGYAVEDAYYFADGSTELTITLKAA